MQRRVRPTISAQLLLLAVHFAVGSAGAAESVETPLPVESPEVTSPTSPSSVDAPGAEGKTEGSAVVAVEPEEVRVIEEVGEPGRSAESAAPSGEAALVREGSPSPRGVAPTLREEMRGKDLEGSPEPPPQFGEPLPPAEAPDDLAGRGSDPTDAGDVLIWFPRVAFFPLYAVLEYGVRIPVVWTVTKVEESHLVDKITDLLSWDDGRARIYPMLYMDFGVRPNIGLMMNWTEFAPYHDLSLAAFGGPGDLWAAAGSLKQHLFRNRSATMEWSGGYVRRPDNVFFSLDDDVSSPCEAFEDGCRYRSAIAEAHMRLTTFEEYLSGLEFDLMVRHARFSTASDEPMIPTGLAETLPGFDGGYLLLRPHVQFTLDTRAREVDFTRGTGVRLELFGSFNTDLEYLSRSWLRGGFELAGFFDFGTGQIIGARVYAETIGNTGADGIGDTDEPVPFYELIHLGGSDRLRGFLRGRLRGHHAWEATVEYRYPILWAVDAGFFGSVGNVYGAISDFAPQRNYLNYGFTLRTSGDRGESLEAIVGFGSNRFDSDAFSATDQFRLTVGINKGF